MAREMHVPEDVGDEVAAPSGYYQPTEEARIEYRGRQVLYVSGVAYVEASCCGAGSWQYIRVEGYVAEERPRKGSSAGNRVAIETIEDDGEKRAIKELVLGRHPGARIEFR